MSRGRYSRREFLKTVVITAGAVQAAPLLGCGDNGGGTNPDAPPSNPDGRNPDAPVAVVVTFPQSVASGDPRPDSIVLWTRAATTGGGDTAVTLEVATDQNFTQLVTLSTSQLTASAAHDYCLRVKIVGLTAATRYFYRFKAGTVVSPVGKTKTAPAAGTDVPAKFAVLSCQDYVGRYYNTLLELLAAGNADMDFVVHLGDYIYETTGDPGFQQNQGRNVTFSDTAGAIALGSAASPYYAAKSLSNYRELYQTYRSDKTLQKVREAFPFIHIWDDHEYSNDCWKDVATYFDGKKDEKDTERRRNAEQAFFEYMPIALDVETGSGALALTRPDQLFPNLKLYRDFRYGKHLHLILTDFRSFRPDHPIPEDGFPGTVVMDEATTTAVLTSLGQSTGILAQLPTYVAIDDFPTEKAAAVAALTTAYTNEGLSAQAAAAKAAAVVKGNLDAAALKDATGVDLTASATKHGISFASMGKTTLFGQIGSRYLVVQGTYDLWAAYRVSQDPNADNPYGTEQSTWLDGRLAAEPDATWKVLGSSTSQTSFQVNLAIVASMLPPGVPATNLYLDCDGWDGFPVGVKQLHAKLAPKNVVIVSGDIHASYVADFGADDSGNRLIELTGSSVSSQTFAGELKSEAMQVPALAANIDKVEALIAILDNVFLPMNKAIKYSNSTDNGVVVVTVNGTTMTGVYSLLPPDAALTDSTGSPAQVTFTRVTATVTKSGGKNGALVLTK